MNILSTSPDWQTIASPSNYSHASDIMRSHAEAVIQRTTSEIVFVTEHKPVYTAGTSAKDDELLNNKGFDVVIPLLKELRKYVHRAIINHDSISDDSIIKLNDYINNNSTLEKMFVSEKSPIRLNIDTSATGDQGKINKTLHTLEDLVHIYFTFLCPLFGKNNQNKKEITIYEHFQSLIKASRPTFTCPKLINNINEYKENFITNGILDHAIKHNIITLKHSSFVGSFFRPRQRQLTEDVSAYPRQSDSV